MRETLDNGYTLHVFLNKDRTRPVTYRVEVIDPSGESVPVRGRFGGLYISPEHAYVAGKIAANRAAFSEREARR